MKKILYTLILISPFFANAQCMSHDDSLDMRLANRYDKEYLKVWLNFSNQTVSISWFGNCEEIRIESNNGEFFPTIDAGESNHLHLHNFKTGEYTIMFYNEGKLIKTENFKT
jgi:hypothetical protein